MYTDNIDCNAMDYIKFCHIKYQNCHHTHFMQHPTSDQTKYILDETEAKIILIGSQKRYDDVPKIYSKNDFLKHIIIAKNTIELRNKNFSYFYDYEVTKNKSIECENLSKIKRRNNLYHHV